MVEREIPVLYKRKEECCGCTACYAICPKEAISMVEDEEGFEYPQIDESKCVRYIPLTPQYLLMIGKGKDDIGSIDVHTITNQGVRFYNNIILSKATNAVLSTKKYLGYIL